MMKNNEKVLIFSSKFAPSLDGLSSHTTNIFEALGTEFDVYLLTASSVPYGRFPSERIFNLVHKWKFLELLKHYKKLQKYKFDHILVEYVPSMYARRGGINFSLTIFFLYLRLFSKSKITIHFHELYFPFSWYWKHMILHISHRIMLAIAINSANYAIFSSQKNLQLGMGHSFFEKPKNWLPSFSPMKQVTEIPTKTKGEKIELVIFGSHHPSKNTKFILESLDRINANKKIHLSFIGPTRQELQDQGLLPEGCESFIDFFPKLADDDVVKIMRKSHYLIAYFSDGICSRRSSVSAAFSQGLQVISTRGADPKCIFQDRRGIYLFSPDEDKFYKSISSLLEGEYFENGREVLNFYEKNLSLDVAIKRLKSLWGV